MAGQPDFFDIDERLRELSSKGDDLERLKRLVDFELFRADLEEAVSRADRCKGGRPPFDHVLMFKVLRFFAVADLWFVRFGAQAAAVLAWRRSSQTNRRML